MKIAIFDFCETLVKFSSIDKFFDMVNNENGVNNCFLEKIRIFLLRLHIIQLLEKITRGLHINEAIKLYELKGLTSDRLEKIANKFYLQEIRKNYNEVIYNDLLLLQKEGYKVIIVSGAYDIYLKFVKEQFGDCDLICTKLKFKNEIFTGKVIKNRCIGYNKLIKLKEHINMLNESNIEKIVLFTDSYGDKPLINYCDESYIVCHDSVPKWVIDKKYKFIIWN